MTVQEAHKTMQDYCGIKAGDTVKVLRKAKDYEMGWNNTWNTDMDEMVGKEFIVRRDPYSAVGVTLKCSYLSFPFFVLEIVKKKKEEAVELTVADVEKKFGHKVKIVKG